MSINNVQTRYISKKVVEKVSFSSPKVELCCKLQLHVSYVYGIHSYCLYLIIYCSKIISGNNEKPIIYHVDRTRDGQTYTSRNIKATQEGIPIFTMQASFKVDEVDPLEHQFTMPVVPDPEELISSMQYIRNRLE